MQVLAIEGVGQMYRDMVNDFRHWLDDWLLLCELDAENECATSETITGDGGRDEEVIDERRKRDSSDCCLTE